MQTGGRDGMHRIVNGNVVLVLRGSRIAGPAAFKDFSINPSTLLLLLPPPISVASVPPYKSIATTIGEELLVEKPRSELQDDGSTCSTSDASVHAIPVHTLWLNANIMQLIKRRN